LKYDLPRRNVALIIVTASRELAGVYETHFGFAGLRIVAKFHNADDLLSHFDNKVSRSDDAIVLMDHKNQEMNSREIVRQLKEKNPKQKIILTVTDGSARHKIDKSLFDEIIFKPFTMSELLNAIRNVTSLVRLRGSAVFNDPREMYTLFSDALSDSSKEVCVCLDSTGINRRIDVSDYTPMYLQARTKGLPVRLITEVTRENVSTCKQLMVNRGVQVRHLEGIAQNFSIYDAKHFFEATVFANSSSTIKQIIYSNLDPTVNKNQYLFEELWKIGKPANSRIGELEASPDLNIVKIISGFGENLETRIRMIRNANISYDICTVSGLVNKEPISMLDNECGYAIARGVHIRFIFEISREDVDTCNRLTKMGIEVRHLSNSSSVFALSEKEYIGMVTPKHFGSNEETQSIYSDYPDYVQEQRSIFEALWKTATPVIERMKEFEEKQELEPKTGYCTVDSKKLNPSRA
jgi:DNA-binding response OmpR family regulator